MSDAQLLDALISVLMKTYKGNSVLVSEVASDLARGCKINGIKEPINNRIIENKLKVQGYEIAQTGCSACGGRVMLNGNS